MIDEDAAKGESGNVPVNAVLSLHIVDESVDLLLGQSVLAKDPAGLILIHFELQISVH
jgi:hypothetical protein